MPGSRAILDDIHAALNTVWDRMKAQPQPRFLVSSRTYMAIARASMRKRQFRRWRGKFRAQYRSH